MKKKLLGTPTTPRTRFRQSFARYVLLPTIISLVIVSAAISYPSVTTKFKPTSLNSSNDVQHSSAQDSITPVSEKHLDSPIFLPPATVSRVPPKPDNPLYQQLAIIRDVQNWRVLGDHDKEPGFYDYKDTRLTEEANIAFFLQLSEANMLLAPRLLSRIWHPENVYGIHFDRKIPREKTDMFINALDSNPKLSNIIVIPSVPVTYTGVTEVLNTIESITSLVQVSQSWDYYINLSGSDYPMLSATAMRRLLGIPELRQQSVSFIHYARSKIAWHNAMKGRLGMVRFDLSLGFDHNSSEPLHHSGLEHPVVEKGKLAIEFARGSAWIMAHRKFCEIVAHSNVARRLLLLSSNMKDASEHYFQTLAWNHRELNQTTIRENMRFVRFHFNGVESGQHPYYIDRQTSDGFWEMWHLLSHSPSFFSRKFRILDSSLLQHIDTQKSGATHGVANMTAVSQSFKLVKKKFACLVETRSTSAHETIASCPWKGKKEKGCYEDPEKPCAGDFLKPPP